MARVVLKEGDAAPDFVLRDADGQEIRLSRLGKPALVYFYPKDETPGCVLEARGFRDRFPELSLRGITVVGISLDSCESHEAFRARHRLPFLLLSDPDGRVHDLYGAWRTTLIGRNHFAVRRCSFLIDGRNVIRRAYGHVNPLTHAGHVLRDAEALATASPPPP